MAAYGRHPERGKPTFRSGDVFSVLIVECLDVSMDVAIITNAAIDSRFLAFMLEVQRRFATPCDCWYAINRFHRLPTHERKGG